MEFPFAGTERQLDANARSETLGLASSSAEPAIRSEVNRFDENGNQTVRHLIESLLRGAVTVPAKAGSRKFNWSRRISD